MSQVGLAFRTHRHQRKTTFWDGLVRSLACVPLNSLRVERKNVMHNQDYLKQRNIALQTPTYNELLEVLESYGENHWWVSEDARTRAYYQALDENRSLILPYRQYVTDLTALLGREVLLSEIMMSNRTLLKQEVEQAWKIGALA